MLRCARCIIPASAEGIDLDKDGLCPLCRAFRKPVPKGAQALEEELEKSRTSSSEYDCVVPVSGGRDSAYALYYAKKVLGLNVLAVHNDNDFETEIARQNLDAMSASMDVKIIRTYSKLGLSKKIVSEKFKMNTPFGPGLIVDQTCEACKYGFEAGTYNVAKANGVRAVVWGDSNEESTQSYHALFPHRVPTKRERLMSTKLPNVLAYKYYFSKLRHEYGADSPDGLVEIHLYDYIEWDRRTIVDVIQKEMGWSKPADSKRSWRIDCSLVPLVNYLTKRAYGVSKLELGYSSFIRNGKMTREEAMEQLSEAENSISMGDLEKIVADMKVPLRYFKSL